jgi:hypothetical protein
MFLGEKIESHMLSISMYKKWLFSRLAQKNWVIIVNFA